MVPATTPPVMPAMHSSRPQFSLTKLDFRPSTASVCLANEPYHCMMAWRRKPLQNSTPAMVRMMGLVSILLEDRDRAQARTRRRRWWRRRC